jgi:hypothetical protein
MSLIYVAGYEADAIRRAALSASSQHTEHPASRAGNGDQSAPFRWNAPAANAWLKADLNFVLNGGFEDTWIDSDRPPRWTPDDGAGSLNEETTEHQSGNKSLRINGVKLAYQDLIVIPGKKYKLEFSIKGDGSNYAYVYVQDLDTLKWLTSGSVFQASKIYTALQQSAASWGSPTRTFTVEKPTIRRYYTRLRIFCASEAAGDAYFDSFAIYPEVNLGSVHAHNIPPAATLKLQYDDTGAFSGSETDATTFSVRPRSFYNTFTAALSRYWRLLLVEETGLTPYLGAWSMGHYNTLAQFYRWGFGTSFIQPQVREQTPSGRLISRRRTSDPHRRYALSFMAETEAARDEVLEDMFEASGWGDEPLIVVPDTDGDGAVLQTRVEDVFEYVTEPGTTWDYNVVLAEDPYPVEFNF